jgi:hypothetical protein
MPAACRQTTEPRGLRSLVIKMERLRIGSECLDLLLIDSMRSAHKSLSHVKVLQVKAAISTRIACLSADQVWALLSMRVQLADSDQPHAQSAAVRFGGLGRRYVLVVFADRPAGLLSHADGSGLFPEARPKLTALSWEEIRLALMLDISSN